LILAVSIVQKYRQSGIGSDYAKDRQPAMPDALIPLHLERGSVEANAGLI